MTTLVGETIAEEGEASEMETTDSFIAEAGTCTARNMKRRAGWARPGPQASLESCTLRACSACLVFCDAMPTEHAACRTRRRRAMSLAAPTRLVPSEQALDFTHMIRTTQMLVPAQTRSPLLSCSLSSLYFYPLSELCAHSEKRRVSLSAYKRVLTRTHPKRMCRRREWR